ncbi:MAG TPA: hypothetical protein VMW25_05110 [Clostridia bacterium]|nr:hypothetical protein [Clostridia bacterium]
MMPEKLSRRDFLRLAGLGIISTVLGACKKDVSTSEAKITFSSAPPTATPESSGTMTPISSATTTEAPTVTPTIERFSWVVEVSNTEARFNQDFDNGEGNPKGRWEYYSTAEGEKDNYIVSVKQNEEGECYFHNFAEEVDVVLHPELLSDATFNEIIEVMKKTGAVKYIPCSGEGIRKLKVQMYGTEPGALIIYPKLYPLRVYYSHFKGGQANPGYPLMAIILADVNQGKEGWETRWVQVYALDDSGKARVMSPSESLVESGVLAGVGTPIMEIQRGLVKILGRQEYNDADNRMFLDSFARDPHGRLMVPLVSSK